MPDSSMTQFNNPSIWFDSNTISVLLHLTIVCDARAFNTTVFIYIGIDCVWGLVQSHFIVFIEPVSQNRFQKCLN